MTASKPDTSKFDVLRAYFKEDYQLNERIVIHQPTIGDVLEIGEDVFYSSLFVFIGNPTTFRLELWRAGKDWNKITDFELFMHIVQGANPDFTSRVFGDIDFTLFEPARRIWEDGEDIVLANRPQDIIIDEETYLLMRDYLRFIFNIYPKVEKAGDSTTKEWIIMEEEEKYNRRMKENTHESILLPLVSACVNHPGFKYKTSELKEVGIFQFMDSVNRLRVYESSTALLKGVYSGFVDGTKIDSDEFNFMRSI